MKKKKNLQKWNSNTELILGSYVGEVFISVSLGSGEKLNTSRHGGLNYRTIFYSES